MSSVNKVTLIGRLGRDPEFHTFPDGNKVCNMSIATDETWKDKKSNERKQRTEWHRVVILASPLVNYAERFAIKGSQVYIEGQLATRDYEAKDGSGKKNYVTEVAVRPYVGEFKILSGGKRNDGEGAANSNGNSNGSGRSTSQESTSPDAGYGYGNSGGGYTGGGNLDDDIPF